MPTFDSLPTSTTNGLSITSIHDAVAVIHFDMLLRLIRYSPFATHAGTYSPTLHLRTSSPSPRQIPPRANPISTGHSLPPRFQPGKLVFAVLAQTVTTFTHVSTELLLAGGVVIWTSILLYKYLRAFV